MTIRQDLKALGWSKDLIDKAMVDGKPIAETEEKKPSRVDGDHYKSKTERYYAWELDEQKKAGDISRWEYEALKFRLAWSQKDGTRGVIYTPDFCVWYPDGKLELREIKGGFIREAARVRYLVAQRLYPEFKWRMIQRTKDGSWVDIL